MIKVKEPPTDKTKSIDFPSTPAISSSLQRDIAAAVRQLQKGGTVVFPTETVYGLGADISIPSAVEQIFEIKGRPKNHPLIVHFGHASQLQYWAHEIPESAWKLAANFWPGPLTLILKRSKHVPPIVTGGQNTVGLRIPNHPVALALLHALGAKTALAAPSANRFGRISPTTAAHAKDELGQSVNLILDGGPCQVGLESTIVSFTNETATVLRPGGIPISALETVLNKKIPVVKSNQLTTPAPGTLASHYAPATPLELCPAQKIWHHAYHLSTLNLSVAVITWSVSTPNHNNHNNIVQFSMPQEPTAYGNQLYATLRQFDQQGFDRLVIETPPDNPAWLTILDRLRRASQTKIQL